MSTTVATWLLSKKLRAKHVAEFGTVVFCRNRPHSYISTHTRQIHLDKTNQSRFIISYPEGADLTVDPAHGDGQMNPPLLLPLNDTVVVILYDSHSTPNSPYAVQITVKTGR